MSCSAVATSVIRKRPVLTDVTVTTMGRLTTAFARQTQEILCKQMQDSFLQNQLIHSMTTGMWTFHTAQVTLGLELETHQRRKPTATRSMERLSSGM